MDSTSEWNNLVPSKAAHNSNLGANCVFTVATRFQHQMITSACHDNQWPQYERKRYRPILTHHRRGANQLCLINHQAIQIVAISRPLVRSISISRTNIVRPVREEVHHPMKYLLPKPSPLHILFQGKGNSWKPTQSIKSLWNVTAQLYFCQNLPFTVFPFEMGNITKQSSMCCQTLPGVFIVWS